MTDPICIEGAVFYVRMSSRLRVRDLGLSTRAIAFLVS